MTTNLDRESLVRNAERDVGARNYAGALSTLWKASEKTRAVDTVFVRQLDLFRSCFTGLGKSRAVATIELFNHSAQALRAAQAGADPRDVARVFVAQKQPAQAAEQFMTAGWFGHAAIQLEQAKNDRGSHALWQKLSIDPRLTRDLYTRALVFFNLSRALQRLGEKSDARRTMVESMRLLEAAADEFESRGLRERAFDCYQVLLTIGREGAFENLAEGYLNSIRILKQDHLKYYVLQYYEDFQGQAFARNELHAAATLCREAADFCARNRLPYVQHYKQKAADAYINAARQADQKSAPAQMVENAYAAAIDVLNDLGANAGIRSVFAAMAELNLTEKRRERYARLSSRYDGTVDQTVTATPFPAHLKMDAAYPDVWRLDVIEWEQRGDAAETMAEVAFDSQWPEFTRARALLCRLFAQSGLSQSPTAAELEALAGHLGRTEIYVALAPLEALFLHPTPRIRAAVARALRQLYFKRSFTTVIPALRDDDANVRAEALAAVGELHFTHAFDSLARIFREGADAGVRRTALVSIGKIQSLEALDFLVTTFLQQDRELGDVTRDLLIHAEHSETRNVVQRAADEETGPKRDALMAILKARGSR